MHAALTKIEFVANDDPKDASYLYPTEIFESRKKPAFFDQGEYERKSLFWWIGRSVEMGRQPRV
jgi:hypothetical protein